MAGKIKKMIDLIIQERSKGNPAIVEMTKAKLILKGINLNKFENSSEDDPVVINKLLAITKELKEIKLQGDQNNIKSVFSIKSSEEDIVSDLKNQFNGFRIKLLIFFASSCFDQDKLSFLMQEAFKDCIVFGCSTAGEIVSGKMLKNSVVAMAFNSNIFSDAKVEIIELANEKSSIETAFTSFENYYNESAYTMDATRYLGIILIDGLSMKAEKVMDLIGNRTNVVFVGGSAGDDLKFTKTFICANGKAYTNSAALILLKMNEYAEFGIVKTQSFKVLDHVLIANKVNEETKEIIEFNNKPAILAYAEAVGATSVEEATKCFMTNPVGLVLSENQIFVRAPRQIKGTNLQFFCNLLEGMEVSLLEATDIIKDTKNALKKKISEMGRIDGILNFHCVKRTMELEKRNLVRQYGEIFTDIPTIGLSTYGEQYIGHVNQTATMLVFKSNDYKSYNYEEGYTHLEISQKESYLELIDKLIKENRDMYKMLLDRKQQLEETTTALKEFNIMLEDEINIRTKREEEIRYLSYYDILTGLYNRRFYEEEIKRVDTKRNLPISIIMGDVNGLKLINDAFGHEKGDELLIEAAKGIKNACRADDIAARWGGDEFVILLPKTTNEEAEGVVKRIKDQYTEQEVKNIQVSVSFGWETKKKSNEDILKILKKAEDYMYQQKIIENEVINGNLINTIYKTLYERNAREEKHSKNVGELCQKFGSALGLSELEASKLKTVGVLHDIGKIVIDDNTLNKKEKLSELEWSEIKRHTDIGYKILTSSFNVLDLADGVLSHHERWDGTGYPRGLKGEAIPMAARIIALADSYDAMTSDRPYRKALSEDEAVVEIKKNAGTQFEPELAKIFVEKVLGKQWS